MADEDLKTRVPLAFEPMATSKEPYQIKGSTLQAASAAWDLSAFETPLNAIGRMVAIDDLEERGPREKIDPQELNQKYPGLSEPFTEPQNAWVAEHIATQQKDRQRLMRASQSGPDTTLSSVTSFSAALIPHALDPINVGVGFATAGLFNLGRATYQATKTAKAGMSARQLAIESSEAFLGNLAVEPLVLAASDMDNSRYTIEDAFVNSIAGAIAFPGIRYGLSKAKSFVKGVGKGAEEAIHTSSVGRLANGKKVDVEPQIKQFVKETDGTSIPYSFEPLRDGQFSAKSFYAANSKADADDLIGGGEMLHDDFGNGVYISDNPNNANGAAARSTNPVEGTVFEVALPDDFRPINLDNPILPEHLAAIEKVYGEKGFDPEDALNGRELMEKVKEDIKEDVLAEDAIEQINEALMDQGYDGYLHNGGPILGVEHGNANHIVVFDPERITPKGRMKANRKAVPKPSRDEVEEIKQKTLSEESDLDFDPEAKEQLKQAEDLPEVKEVRPEDLQKEIEDIKTTLDSLEKNDLLDEETLKFMDEVRQSIDDESLIESIYTDLSKCIKGA